MKLTLSILMFIVGNLACMNSTSAQNPNELIAGCCTAGGKCVGKANCSACRTCENCRYCNSGGSCGVCAGRNNFSEYPFPLDNITLLNSQQSVKGEQTKRFYNMAIGLRAFILTAKDKEIREYPPCQ